MVGIALFPLLLLSIAAFVVGMVLLWRRGKTVEALLLWNSMFLYFIALILLFA